MRGYYCARCAAVHSQGLSHVLSETGSCTLTLTFRCVSARSTPKLVQVCRLQAGDGSHADHCGCRRRLRAIRAHRGRHRPRNHHPRAALPSRRGGRGQRRGGRGQQRGGQGQRRLRGRRRPRGLAAPRGANLVGAGDRLRQRRHRGEQPTRQRGRPAGSARMDRRGRPRPLARLCVGLAAGVCVWGDLDIVWQRSLARAPPAADRGRACALQPARPLPGRRLQLRDRRGRSRA